MSDKETSLREIILSTYLPTMLFSAAEGTMLPVLPTVAQDLGANLAFAGFIASLLAVGKLLGDIPSGWFAARFGDRNAMLGATAFSALSLLFAALAVNPLMLGVGVLLMGMAESTFGVARSAFLAVNVPLRFRARALSMLGGTGRAGWVLGPFVAAGVTSLLGSPSYVFWFSMIFVATAGVVLLVVHDPDRTASALRSTRRRGREDAFDAEALAERRRSNSVRRAVRDNWSNLWRLGLCAGLLQGLRSSRQVLVPLWGVAIGLDPEVIALLVGIASSVDFLLSYTSGQVMDRFGRFWACVPPAFALGTGYLLLSLSGFFGDAGVGTSQGWFIGVSIAISFANGISSGVLMTLGADLAPRENPAPFLGAWRFSADTGATAMPLLISALTALASLGVASAAVGVIGYLGGIGFIRWLPQRHRVPGSDEA